MSEIKIYPGRKPADAEEMLRDALLRNSDYEPQDILEMVAADQATFVTFECDGVEAGMAVVQEVKTPAGTWLHDAHVWVVEASRMRGIYSSYITWLKEYARTRGYRGVTLNVYAAEPYWTPILQGLGLKPRTVTYEWRS